MKRRLFALLATACVGLVGACGGQSKDPGAAATSGDAESLRDLVLASASKVAEEKTASFEASFALLPGEQRFSATGAIDSARSLLSMSIDLGSFLGGAAPGGGKAEMILDGKAFYMRGFLPLGGDQGAQWIRIDLEQLSGKSGLDLSGILEQFKSLDPKSQLGMLAGVADDVKEVGTEEVRGVKTRHLKASVDLERALAEMPPAFKATASPLGKAGVSALPVELWVDAEGLPRRLSVDIDLSKLSGADAPAGSSGSSPTSMSLKVEFFDFGEAVRVEVPGPGQYLDISELNGSGRNGAPGSGS